VKIIMLTEKQVEDLFGTFENAERGREDFEYLAGQDAGDYSPGDVRRQRAKNERQVKVEDRVRAQIKAQEVFEAADVPR